MTEHSVKRQTPVHEPAQPTAASSTDASRRAADTQHQMILAVSNAQDPLIARISDLTAQLVIANDADGNVANGTDSLVARIAELAAAQTRDNQLNAGTPLIPAPIAPMETRRHSPLLRSIKAGSALLARNQFIVLGMVVLIMSAFTGLLEGTLAAFTDRATSNSNTFSTGYVQFDWRDSSNVALANGFITVSNMVPGDSVSRNIKVSNGNAAGQLPFIYSTAVTQTNTLNALTTDATNGLKLRIERCNSSWASCSVITGFNTVPISLTNVSMGGPTANAIGTGVAGVGTGITDYLRVTVVLPTTAGQPANILNFQNKTATLRFTWTAQA